MRLLLPLLLLLAACAAGPGGPRLGVRTPARVETVSIPLPDGTTLRGLLALPAGAPTASTVVALHGCGGIGGPERAVRLSPRETDWAAELTEAGHPVVFPDSFGSRGLGEACGVAGFPAGPLVRRGDAHATAAWAATQPWARPGPAALIGWSHGGSTVLTAAAEPVPPGLIDRAVAYYPGCFDIGRAERWRPGVPVLMLLGGSDDWTPASYCQGLAARFPGRLRQVTYPGALHGFDGPATRHQSRWLPNGRQVSFGSDPAARVASMAEVRAFLAAR
jgi:dienelactone hydrolase